MTDAVVVDQPPPERDVPAFERMAARAAAAARGVHPAAWLTLAGAGLFAVIFGSLGVRHYNSFGSWSYDMAIYDQGFWLVSRGGQSFMTVRGMEFWGHHLNLVALVFAPFYWLGAGPSFLYVAQAIGLGAAAIPTYLIARDRFKSPWMGFLFAFAYLMYAPIQWISWANFHPEALVITPFLFAWWFARQQRWTGCFVSLGIAMATREDTALAVVMVGLVLVIVYRRNLRARTMSLFVAGFGALWYLIATKLVMPYFNDWKQPFYIKYFYGHYGDTLPDIAKEIIAHPNRVIEDATQPDRIRFYRDLFLPLGALPLAGIGFLVMAGPQMMASVIGMSPYARSIRYQYTSVMIAPIVIAAIEGAWLLWRMKAFRVILPVWLVLSSLITNIAWSPSPISDNYWVWAKPDPRHETMREAVAMVPDGASVSATYLLLPHLAHREEAYDWPNPFVPAYWGNDDCDRLPSPTTVEYVVLDRAHIGPNQQQLVTDMFADGGPFEVLLDRDQVVVGRRVGTTPSVDVQPQASSCRTAGSG